MPSAAENHEINWIGNMSTFSTSENNESMLSNCRTQKMYRIVNNHVEFLIAFPLSHTAERSLLQLCYGEEMYRTQIVGTRKSAYSKGNALI